MDAASDQGVAELASRYLEYQLKGDRRRAVRVLLDEGLDRGVPATDILLRVITPAQREIGKLWETNQVSIADEHVATAISQLAMSYLYSRAAPVGVRREHVLISCVEGEWHDMGGRLAADVLEHHGFSVCLLGPSVPTADLITRIREEAPDIVLLSIAVPTHLPSLIATFERLRTTFRSLPVLVGGCGLDDAAADDASFPLPPVSAERANVCLEIERLLQS